MTRLLLIFLLFSPALFAQQATVTYRQLQYVDGKPVPQMKLLLAVRDSVGYALPLEVHGRTFRPKEPLGSSFELHADYMDLSTGRLLMQNHPGGLGRYLIEDTVATLKWTLLDEEKTVLGQRCKKAITELNGQTVTAWYAPGIPLPFGPNLLHGLPGLILEADYQRPVSVVEAVELKREAPAIVPPNRGKRVTLQQFREELRKRDERN